MVCMKGQALMKSARHEAILRLVSEQTIQTQDELIERLRELGFCVTQATVSRDIRELTLTKILTSQGTYRYVIPASAGAGAITKINETLLGAITNIDYANNIIVVTTFPGMAQAVLRESTPKRRRHTRLRRRGRHDNYSHAQRRGGQRLLSRLPRAEAAHIVKTC